MPDTFLHGFEQIEIDDGLRTIEAPASSIVGFVGTAPDADREVYPLNTPVLVTGPRMAAALGPRGTLIDAFDAVYAQGIESAIVVRASLDTKAAVLGDAALQTGVYALGTSPALLGITPRILAAPGFTQPDDPAANDPIATALQTVAEQLRAIALIDGPNTTEAEAIAYAGLFASDRLMLIDAAPRVFDAGTQATGTRPGSGYAAGVIAATDKAFGFWWSPSNRPVEGITGTARRVGFSLSRRDTEANRLNEAGITTIVRRGGYRIWGNRSLTADPAWQYLSVRRTADMIYEAVEVAHAWALDRPFGQQLLLDIKESVQAYVDDLVRRGALLGGSVWIDPELNTEAALRSGELFVDFDIEPPAPIERLTFTAHRNGEIFGEVTGSVGAELRASLASAPQIAPSDTPDLFAFTDLVDQELGVPVFSEIVEITGIFPDAQVEISGGSFRLLTAEGVEAIGYTASPSAIEPSWKLQLRTTSSTGPDAENVVTLTVGDRTVQWSVRTAAAEAVWDVEGGIATITINQSPSPEFTGTPSGGVETITIGA